METSFLFQRVSVLQFRLNSVLLHDGLCWMTAQSIGLFIFPISLNFFPTLVFTRVKYYYYYYYYYTLVKKRVEKLRKNTKKLK